VSAGVFEGARTKIDRAREQTQTLQAEFQTFIDSKPYAVPQILDEKTRRKTATYKITESFPLRWSAMIGEILHDLRSALDNTIYEMTCIEQGGPLKQTEFPVFDDESEYDRMTKKGDPAPGSGVFKIRGINNRAKALFRLLQPFEFKKTYPSPNDQHILGLLHELNIVDKHRTIHLCRVRTKDFGLRS